MSRRVIAGRPPWTGLVEAHLSEASAALRRVSQCAPQLAAWGAELAEALYHGQRLLVAGNGGSAAEAQHLTAELVGRYRGDRRPFSAIALHAETSTLTAVGNDYGFDEIFARQVRAHGRSGDVLLVFTTSGSSANLLAAIDAARGVGMTTWALTGRPPNAVALAADEAIAIEAPAPAVQECHLMALHALSGVFDAEIARRRAMEALEVVE